jgi:hypothetical protein
MCNNMCLLWSKATHISNICKHSVRCTVNTTGFNIISTCNCLAIHNILVYAHMKIQTSSIVPLNYTVICSKKNLLASSNKKQVEEKDTDMVKYESINLTTFTENTNCI